MVKLLLAAWVLYRESGSAFIFDAAQKLYLVVILIYFTNIFVDVYLQPNPFVSGNSNGPMDLLGFSINILLALSFRYDASFDSRNSYNFFIFTLAVGLLLAFHFAKLTPRLLLFDEDSTRYDANSTVNTIMYGQMGCAMCLASLFGLLKKNSAIWKGIFFVLLILGFASIAKAGSRSPVVVFAVVMAFYLTARMGMLKGLLLFAFGIVLLIIFMDPLISLLHSMGSNIGDRLKSAIVDRDTSGRELIWRNVIGLIKKSPIWGVYYIVPSGEGAGMYPHNFYLEAFMATGIIGGLPFLILVGITVVRSYNLIRLQHRVTWIILLYLQVLIFGFFSTSLYSAQEFWILMFMILTINVKPVAHGPGQEIKARGQWA